MGGAFGVGLPVGVGLPGVTVGVPVAPGTGFILMVI